MTIGEALALFGGTQAVLLGIVTYLGKVWLAGFERRLEATLEKSIHASQAQFDREFLFYQDVWGKLATARSSIRGTLQPETELSDRDGDADAEEFTHASELAQVADDLWEVTEANEPFFPQEFAEDLRVIRDLATFWSKEVRSGRSRRSGWLLNDGVPHLNKMNEAYDKLKKKIRARLERVATTEPARVIVTSERPASNSGNH